MSLRQQLVASSVVVSGVRRLAASVTDALREWSASSVVHNSIPTAPSERIVIALPDTATLGPLVAVGNRFTEAVVRAKQRSRALSAAGRIAAATDRRPGRVASLVAVSLLVFEAGLLVATGTGLPTEGLLAGAVAVTMLGSLSWVPPRIYTASTTRRVLLAVITGDELSTTDDDSSGERE